MKLNAIAVISLMLAPAILLFPAQAQAQSSTYTYSYEGPAFPIYRDSANIISLVNIFVPRAIQITKVTANIQIDYPNPGDLNVFMYSPILTRTILLEKNCGSQASVRDVTFDDSAPSRYSDACPSSSGTYRGNEPLSNFNNQNAAGTWTLAVENNGSDNTIGYIRGFSVTLTGSEVTTKPITGPNAVFNAASFQSGAVAPGEMVSIQGVNLGPFPGVSAPSGNLPTSLGGVQVSFDGTPGAISYASADQLNVQVPFSVQPGQQTKMSVVYQNNTSDSVTLDVVSAAPGLYTASGYTGGLVSAINQDGSTNSLTHPAARGSYVILYASGLGLLTPSLTTGQTPPTSPLSNTTVPVSVLVDGVPSTPSFAGAAPGYPGLYQINVQIPAAVRSGSRFVTLFADGTPSQFGALIVVQ